MKTAKILGPLVCLVLLVGCSLYRNDRQFVWDSEYQKVRDLYDRCGSMKVIQQVLRDRKWTRAQINEVVYRLEKDYWLDADGMPHGIDRPRPVAVESSALAGMGLGTSSRGRDDNY
jgi:hypothetical protein